MSRKNEIHGLVLAAIFHRPVQGFRHIIDFMGGFYIPTTRVGIYTFKFIVTCGEMASKKGRIDKVERVEVDFGVSQTAVCYVNNG